MAAVFRNRWPAASQVASGRSARAQAFSFSRLLAAMSFDGSRLDGYERESRPNIPVITGGYDPQRQVSRLHRSPTPPPARTR